MREARTPVGVLTRTAGTTAGERQWSSFFGIFPFLALVIIYNSTNHAAPTISKQCVFFFPAAAAHRASQLLWLMSSFDGSLCSNRKQHRTSEPPRPSNPSVKLRVTLELLWLLRGSKNSNALQFGLGLDLDSQQLPNGEGVCVWLLLVPSYLRW